MIGAERFMNAEMKRTSFAVARSVVLLVFFVMPVVVTSVSAAGFPQAFFSRHCYDCHNGATQKGEIRLDNAASHDWNEPTTQAFFERVLDVLRAGEMPPDTELPVTRPAW